MESVRYDLLSGRLHDCGFGIVRWLQDGGGCVSEQSEFDCLEVRESCWMSWELPN